ncbi:uncharacterized protein LOC131329190 [Rhododendron vialii]|uniref:uncharacterized protein LOC131329190 n=1 Tax=Rhododendron vialii TaxID=182163 RepID=UPI00265E7033|nr:uncharacterized protein LOC131329190 [Rhododendron vialii]
MVQMQNRRSRLVNLGTRQEENVIYGQRATHLSEQNLNRSNSEFHGNLGISLFERHIWRVAFEFAQLLGFDSIFWLKGIRSQQIVRILNGEIQCPANVRGNDHRGYPRNGWTICKM